MSTEVLYVRIDSEVKRELEILAKNAGMTLAKATEIVLKRGLQPSAEHVESASERLQKLITERFQ